MGRLIVFTNVTLDGVMQSSGRAEEDTRDGFAQGGWAAPYGAMQDAGDALANLGALLFGRWTYLNWASYFPQHRENPFTAFLTGIPKYVASTTLREPLPWANSTLLDGEVAPAVAGLKEETDKDIVVFGSSRLVQSLMKAGLVDDFVLFIHPLIIGSGRRLFPDGGVPAALTLRESRATGNGVVVAVYQSANH